MAHAVSLTYARFDHMSPAALAMTTLLHVAVAVALYLVSPLKHFDAPPDVVEITMQRELAPVEAPPPEPSPDPAPPQPAAAPPPPAPPMRLGLAPPGRSEDPKATPGTEQPVPPKPETPAPEAAQPEPPKPEPQQALAPPPPPPPPPSRTLESELPPLEAPPPPVTSREVPRPLPPPPAPKAPPPTQQRVQPAPQPVRPPQQPALQSSPLSHLPQARTPADQQASRQAPTFVNPADAIGQRRAEDQYLWYVAQKLSQHQQFVRNITTEAGTVVLRLTIARDGRLVNVGVSRSSGLPSLDNVSLNMVRQAGPYPPLPNEIGGAQHTFTLPLYFKRND